MDFTGKTVVITGASSGIGRASALEFARRKARVFLAARRADALASAAEECRHLGAEAVAVETDVRDATACRRLIETAGQVDVLVNNAGYAILDSIADANPDELHDMMDTNFFGAVYCTQAVLPQMLSRRSGTIVNVSSIVGLMGYPRMGGYGATKFALAGFSEALRDEVLARGVRVALVCPGTTETDFFVKAERGKLPGASRLLLAIPPERVARAIVASAGDGKYRRILPATALIFTRLKEVAPRFAHALSRQVSRFLEKR